MVDNAESQLKSLAAGTACCAIDVLIRATRGVLRERIIGPPASL